MDGPVILQWFAADELPKILVKTGELFSQRNQRLGVLYRRPRLSGGYE